MHDNLSFQDHGFLSVLKYTELKRILLDHLWIQRSEGIKFLEDLFKHFDKINEVNICKGYSKKFGDPEDYFGFSNFHLGDDISATDLLSFLKDDNIVSDLPIAVREEDFNFFDPLLSDLSVLHCSLGPLFLNSNVIVSGHDFLDFCIDKSGSVAHQLEMIRDFVYGHSSSLR